jgi:hypothetical protein
LKSALQAAEKVDSKRLLVAQALLPVLILMRLSSMHSQEWPCYAPFSAACLAAEVEVYCGSAVPCRSEYASCSRGGHGGAAYKKQFADADLFSRAHARKIHCTASGNADAKTAANR